MNKFYFYKNRIFADDGVDKKLVYHYTSPDNFLSILKNGKLWFSDCQFMNDRSEYVYIKDVYKEAIKGTFLARQYNLLDYALTPYSSKGLVIKDKYSASKNEMIIETQKTVPMRYYILCASLEPDIHSLWSYYSKNNHYQGYNLGVDVNLLVDSISKSVITTAANIIHGEVVYDRETQVKQINEIIKEIDEQYNITEQKKTSKILDDKYKSILAIAIRQRCMFFKNPAFAHEKEYRFVVEAPYKKIDLEGTMAKLDFHIGPSGLIVSHLEIPFDLEAIEAISLAPMMEREVAEQGIKIFLGNYFKKEIIVKFSQIDLRY